MANPSIPRRNKSVRENPPHNSRFTPETPAAAEARTANSPERLGEALVELGAVSEDDVLRALAARRRIPFLSAEELPFTPPVLKNISPKYLRQYAACPIAMEGTTLTVATSD